MHIHKTSAFPFIIIGLTILLAVFIVFTVTDNPPVDQRIAVEDQEPLVTDSDYKPEVKEVVKMFEKNFEAAGTDIAKLVVVENTLSDLLSLRVTGDYKEMHLDLATALNQMQEGLRGEAGSFQKGQDRFDRVLTANPWLR